jgi:hypothetical protein
VEGKEWVDEGGEERMTDGNERGRWSRGERWKEVGWWLVCEDEMKGVVDEDSEVILVKVALVGVCMTLVQCHTRCSGVCRQ